MIDLHFLKHGSDKTAPLFDETRKVLFPYKSLLIQLYESCIKAPFVFVGLCEENEKFSVKFNQLKLFKVCSKHIFCELYFLCIVFFNRNCHQSHCILNQRKLDFINQI